LTVAFGAFVLIAPGRGALAVLWIIGAHAIVLGVVLFALGLQLHGWHRDAHGMPLRGV
jgi:uncharacterized membrane protein HdeD (DUF308 family)